MEILKRPSPEDGPVVLIIGNFDGIHKGHQALIEKGNELARDRDLKTVVLSFLPHPLKLLSPDKAPRLLQTDDQKRRLLAHYGVDAYWPMPFDEALSKYSPREFLDHLCRFLDIRELMVGFNFRFGYRRQGDLALLRQFAEERGFRLHPAKAVLAGGEPVSSSRIRRLVALGEMTQVAELLGRPYFLEGDVVKGRQLGRQLAAPTANIHIANEQLPGFGVYATWVRLPEGLWRRGITNIGYAPTVAVDELRVETHIFDLDRDLYGMRLQLYFGKYLRPEKRFSGIEALKRQIHEDFEKRLALPDLEPPEFFLA